MNKKMLKMAMTSALLVHFGFMQAMPVLALDPFARPEIVPGGIANGALNQNQYWTYVTNNSGMKGIAVFNWGKFNVGADHTVNFIFTNHGQTTLNRVMNSGGMSEIYGKLINSCGGSTSCSLQDTSKVILLNPNGVTFFNGSSVNLNSFTVSSYDGTLGNWKKPGEWDANDRQDLTLTGNGHNGDIIIESGATLYGAKQLSIAAPNVTAYLGSKLSTNVGPDKYDSTLGYGNLNIFTGDGMTFSYNEVGHSDIARNNVTNSANAGTITIGGELTAGTINLKAGNPALVASASPNADIIIRKGAVLKATKMIRGESGAIVLEAAGKISSGELVAQERRNGGAVTDNLTPSRVQIETYNYSDADAARPAGKSFVTMLAAGDVNIANTDIKTALSTDTSASAVDASVINILSKKGAVNISNSNLTATNSDVMIFSDKNTTVSNSNLTGKNIYMNAPVPSQVDAGKYPADAWFGNHNKITNSTLNATNEIAIKAYSNDGTAGNTVGNDISGSTLTAGNKISIKADQDNKLTNSNLNSGSIEVISLRGGNDLNKVVARGADKVSAANTVAITAASKGNNLNNKTDILGKNISITATGDNTINDSKVIGTTVKVTSTNANNTVTNNSRVEATGGELTIDAVANGSNTVSGNSTLAAGIVNMLAKFNNTLSDSTIEAQTLAKMEAKTGNNNITSSTVKATNAAGTVEIIAQGNNTIKDGTNRTKIEGNTVKITGAANTIKNTDIKTNDVLVTAKTGDNTLTSVKIDNGTGVAANKAEIVSALGNVVYDGGAVRALNFTTRAGKAISTVNNSLDATGSTVVMLAKDPTTGNSILGNDINVSLEGIDDRTKGVTAEGYNVTISTTGDLSVHKLWSTNDMTLNAARIIAGNAYNDDIYNNPDQSKSDNGIARAYIRVDGWNFNSFPGYTYTPTDSYELMTGQVPPEGKYPDGTTDFNNKHILTYNGSEADKVFLVHRLPYECPPGPTPDPPDPGPVPTPPDPVDIPTPTPKPDPTNMVLRLPLKYEPTSNLAPILDNRAGVDVIAAAAKVQVAGDNEEDDDAPYTVAE